MTSVKSKWFWWSFLPIFNCAAWIHVAIRTGRASYLWFAAFYGIPLLMAIVLGAMEEQLKLSKGAVEGFNNVAGSAAFILWIVGMIHALLKKDSVDQQIERYETDRTLPRGLTPCSVTPAHEPAHEPVASGVSDG